MSDNVFEWECEDPKCTIKLRVKISEERYALGGLLFVHCPACGTKQIPPVRCGPCYGFQYDDGSGWKDAFGREAAEDSKT